jgi:hypothetical protein
MTEPSTPDRRPARGYSWPTATPGNTIAQTHGVYSPRVLEPATQTALERLQRDVPDFLKDPSYAGALLDLARVEAKTDLVEAWLTQQDPSTPSKRVFSALNLLIRLYSLATNMRTALGLTPAGRARLQAALNVQTKFDLAAMWAAEDDDPSTVDTEVGGDADS